MITVDNLKHLAEQYQQGLANAQANLAEAEADVDRWKAQVAAQRGAIAALEQVVKQAAEVDAAVDYLDVPISEGPPKNGKVVRTLAGEKVVGDG